MEQQDIARKRKERARVCPVQCGGGRGSRSGNGRRIQAPSAAVLAADTGLMKSGCAPLSALGCGRSGFGPIHDSSPDSDGARTAYRKERSRRSTRSRRDRNSSGGPMAFDAHFCFPFFYWELQTETLSRQRPLQPWSYLFRAASAYQTKIALG